MLDLALTNVNCRLVSIVKSHQIKVGVKAIVLYLSDRPFTLNIKCMFCRPKLLLQFSR